MGICICIGHINVCVYVYVLVYVCKNGESMHIITAVCKFIDESKHFG